MSLKRKLQEDPKKVIEKRKERSRKEGRQEGRKEGDCGRSCIIAAVMLADCTL